MTRAFASLLALALAQGSMPGNNGGFRDVTREAGVTFVHHADPEKKYIVESMSGGVALFDYDNDGRLDIYFVDSLTVETAGDPKQARSALYRNLGGFKFSDVTDKAGVGHPGWGMGVCTADVDADGWEDLYVTALGGNKLYRNNHDGTFTDVTERAGVAGGGWSAGCGFADYDRDGDLDLFVSRYVKIDLKQLPQFGRDKTCQYRRRAGAVRAARPAGRIRFSLQERGQSALRRGRRPRPASATRADSSVSASPGSTTTRTAGRTSSWPTMREQTSSIATRRTARSRRSRFRWALAVSQDGAEQGSMGVAVADYDNTGRFGILVTNFSEEYNALHRNEGPHFTDVSFKSKIGRHQPAVRRMGDRVLRLRQRQPAGPHRRERSRLSAARQSEARRLGGIPAAQAAPPQPRRRHVRGSGGEVRSNA